MNGQDSSKTNFSPAGSFDLKHWILLMAGIVLLVLFAVAAWAAISSREDKIRAEERDKANQQLIQKNADSEKQREADQRARDAADAAFHQSQDAKIAELAKTIAQLKTPEQHAAFDQAQLEKVIEGIKFKVDQQSGQVIATVPKENIGQVTAAIQECQECKTNLSTAQHDVISKDQTIAALKDSLVRGDQNLKLMTDSRDEYKKTAGGGSFWHKVKVTLRDAACGGGGAAVGAQVGPNKARDAAIGAAVAVIGCTIANH